MKPRDQTIRKGIELRHQRSCASVVKKRAACDCAPSFRIRRLIDGKRVQQTFSTLTEAEATLNEWTYREKMGLDVAVWKTLRHFITEYLDELAIGAGRSMAGDPLKPGTVKDYSHSFKRILAREGLNGLDKPLDSFGHSDAQRLIDLLGEGISRQTQKKYLALVRIIWVRAQKETGTTRDPFKNVICSTFSKSGRNKPAALPMRDAYVIAHEIAEPDLRIIVLFGVFTGMRINEVLALRWKHLHIAAQPPYLEVVENISGGMLGSTPKTKAGTRVIGLATTFVGLLNEYRDWLSRARGPHFVEPDALVCSKAGDPHSPLRADNFYAKLDNRLGPEKARPLRLHVLRAGASAEVVRSGADIHVASKMLGHSSIQTTERHYLELQAKDLAIAGAYVESRLDVQDLILDREAAEEDAWRFYAGCLAEENAEDQAAFEDELRDLHARHEAYGDSLPDPIPVFRPSESPDFRHLRHEIDT